MSDFKLTTLTKTNSNFHLIILPPITDVPTLSFISTLEETDNEYNKSSPLANNCYLNMFHVSYKPFHISMHLIEMCPTV